MRLSSQIVSDIGFLDAGVILRRNNIFISVLLTAFSMYLVSGLGISIGAGYYYEAGVGLLIIVISIRFLPYLIRKYGSSLLRIHEIKIKILINPSIGESQWACCNIKEDINSVDEYVNFYDKISRVAGFK